MTDVASMGWMADVWPPTDIHGALWIGLVIAIAVLAVALIQDWRRG